MTITGTSRNDSILNVSSSKLKKTRADLGLKNDSTVVLFASTYNQKEYDNFSSPELNSLMKKAIFNAANKSKKLTLVVKPHPLKT